MIMVKPCGRMLMIFSHEKNVQKAFFSTKSLPFGEHKDQTGGS
jgi:hypothetical protein